MSDYRDDFARTIEKHRAEGLGWRYDGLDDWPTERIFEQLHQLGIDTDAQRFPEQAASAGRFKTLDEDWFGQMPANLKEEGFWADFPMMAIPVLWERLAPQVICADLIDEHLHRVVTAEDEGEILPDVDGMPADLAAAMELVRFLEGAEPAQRSARFDEVNEDSYYDYVEWVVELIDRRGAKFPDAVTQIADAMSDCCQRDEFQADLAMSLAHAGRKEEAVARATRNLERFPNNFWVRVRAGDVLEELGEDLRAIELWREALALVEDCTHWDAVTERLENALVRADREAEFDEILEQYPEPERPSHKPTPSVVPELGPPSDLPVRDPQEFFPTPPLKAAPKIGRNDPCPCGSGKKYKKCCLH